MGVGRPQGRSEESWGPAGDSVHSLCLAWGSLALLRTKFCSPPSSERPASSTEGGGGDRASFEGLFVGLKP